MDKAHVNYFLRAKQRHFFGRLSPIQRRAAVVASLRPLAGKRRAAVTAVNAVIAVIAAR